MFSHPLLLIHEDAMSGLLLVFSLLTSPACSEHREKKYSCVYHMTIVILCPFYLCQAWTTSKQEKEPMENNLEPLSQLFLFLPFLTSLLWAYERFCTPNLGTSPLYTASPLLAGVLSFPAILSTHHPLTGFDSNYLSLRRPKEAEGMEMIFLSFYLLKNNLSVYFWLCWVFVAAQAFSSFGEWGLLSSCSAQVSFSSWWLLVAEYKL